LVSLQSACFPIFHLFEFSDRSFVKRGKKRTYSNRIDDDDVSSPSGKSNNPRDPKRGRHP
jgi:hypothetical protein